jgi:GNAT superfamily N-acetyltransferase
VLFADAALAARIDRAEADLCATLARAATSDAIVRPVGGGLAIYAKPGSAVNKTIGIGFGERLDEAVLAELEEQWRSRNELVRVELSVLADAENGTILTRRGYRLIGFEHEMGRLLDDLGDEPSSEVAGLRIERVPPHDVPLWREIAVTGFLHLDGTGTGSEDSFSREALEQMMSDFVGAPGFDLYLARIEGEPAGVASVRLHRGLAQLSGATTLPAFRRRGIQTALLEKRLSLARAAGCELAVVTTQPGSKSQSNSQRQGFQLLYARAVLVKSWD